jgi:hypothetical protein
LTLKRQYAPAVLLVWENQKPRENQEKELLTPSLLPAYGQLPYLTTTSNNFSLSSQINMFFDVACPFHQNHTKIGPQQLALDIPAQYSSNRLPLVACKQLRLGYGFHTSDLAYSPEL